ncbi:S-layer homology domain-containing protein [Paenibacillus sp. SAFN-117]|uniref:S-layer homology domain-containing protein n=1 Tax=Paenibacillus sp. SAFN-117 TaxID=3436860 RepID=UPI003F7FB6B8
MGQRSKKVWLLILTIWISCIGLFPTSIGRAVDVLFDQGIGYEGGAYDPDAAQPTAFNWTRQSGYKGSSLDEEKWSYETGDMLESSPAIGSDGTVYVGSNDGKLYALDPHAEDEAGRVKWFYDTGGWIVSSPALGADGTIYVGSHDGNLYALDSHASDDADRVNWFYETGDWIASSPAIGADGTIYVGSYDGKLYALDPHASGDADRVKWIYDVEDWIVSSPVIDSAGIIYVGSYEGKLYALDVHAKDEAERVKWFYDTGLVIESSPAIGSDGTIYVGSYDGKLYALDPHASGDADRVKWFYETDGAIVSSPAIGLDDTIYIGSSDGKLYALDPDAVSDADRVKWFYQTENGIRSSPILDADGTIYVGSYDGKLYALDSHAADEADRLKWFYQIESGTRSSPAIGADGTIYVGSLNGKLYVLGAISLAAPDEVTANADEGAVHLTWNWVDGAARYQIYMHQGITAPDDPADWVSIHEEAVTDTVYTVNNLTAGLPYWLTIKAVSAGGAESGFAEPVSATPYATIAWVEPFHPLQVPKGIAIEHLRLPEAVRVQLSNAAEVDLDVVWDVVQTDYDPEQAGIYTITGLVQLPEYIHHPTSLQAEIRIEVIRDTPAPSKIEIRGAKEITIPTGGETSATEQYEAIVLDENDEMMPNEPVWWSVTDADGVSIDSEQGLLTVTAQASTGQATLKATLISDTTTAGTMNVMLQADSMEQDTEPPQWHEGDELSVSDITQSSVSLSWPSALDNIGVTGYRIYVNDQKRITISRGTYKTTVAELKVDTIYTFKVTAYDGAGNESEALTASAKTLPHPSEPDTEPPAWPDRSELLVSDITRTSVKLSWPAAQDNVAVIGYRLYLNDEKKADGASDKYEYSVTDSVYMYTMRNLSPDTNYRFTVHAYDAAGNESESGLSNAARTLPRASSGGGDSGGGSGAGWYLSSNANLKALEVWVDGKRVSLMPSFRSDTLFYTAKTEAKQIELKASAEHSAAKVTWQDQQLGSGFAIDLKEGGNIIPLIVVAEDGSRKTYTLTIERIQPVEAVIPAISFTDIPGHWSESYIKRAAEKGIVSGYPDGTFKPHHPVTRSEFTVMLAGALKLKGEGAALMFTDNEQIGAWSKQAVAQAVQAGIVEGYEDGSFRPNAQIIRAELAAMIARALKMQTNSSATTGFADNEAIPQWAKGAVEAIRKLGIVDGRGGNRFVPNDTATRAEAAVMLLRMLERSSS